VCQQEKGIVHARDGVPSGREGLARDGEREWDFGNCVVLVGLADGARRCQKCCTKYHNFPQHLFPQHLFFHAILDLSPQVADDWSSMPIFDLLFICFSGIALRIGSCRLKKFLDRGRQMRVFRHNRQSLQSVDFVSSPG
jgi:hypothetical protein